MFTQSRGLTANRGDGDDLVERPRTGPRTPKVLRPILRLTLASSVSVMREVVTIRDTDPVPFAR